MCVFLWPYSTVSSSPWCTLNNMTINISCCERWKYVEFVVSNAYSYVFGRCILPVVSLLFLPLFFHSLCSTYYVQCTYVFVYACADVWLDRSGACAEKFIGFSPILTLSSMMNIFYVLQTNNYWSFSMLLYVYCSCLSIYRELAHTLRFIFSCTNNIHRIWFQYINLRIISSMQIQNQTMRDHK